MAATLSTGISGFDAQLNGGIPPGTVHLVVGEPMNAVQMFLAHFAGAGNGTTYVVTDSEPEDVASSMERIGKDTVVDVTGLGDQLPEPPDGHRYVLDSVSGYIQKHGPDAAFAALDQLKAYARKSKQVVMVAAVSGMHDAQELARLKLWADGVMELGFDRQGFTLYPYLKVTKMRGVPGSTLFLLFKETEQGLFMESTRRVF